MYYECRHILHNGAKCHSPALLEEPFCYFHARLHNLSHPSRSAAKPAPADPLQLPILEDRSAILVAISQIINDLSSKKLDRPTASLCLYGLQIASQNVERKHDLLPFRAVESISHTREGDELAPELLVCESSDDCSACNQRTTCPDSEVEEASDES